MKKKQFDTNIIFRTKKELKEQFKTNCDNNKTTVSKVLNTLIINHLNSNQTKEVEEYFYVGKGHPLYGYYVTQRQYDLFTELYTLNANKDKEHCNDNELSNIYLEIKNNELNNKLNKGE